jgi:hypothetical protein
LVVRGDEEPIKTNSDVLNWLYERKLKDNKPRSADMLPRAPMPATGGSMEPEAWNMAEMGGRLSESYGNLVEGTGASVDNSGSKNFDFNFLNGGASPGDRTAQSMGDSSFKQQEPSRTKSKKEEMFDRQLESYQKNRETGMPQKRQAPNGGRI